MAKMFYTLEEAAQRLSVGEDQVKQFAAAGKLQQFRDRDKLMFKRDQVDAMAQRQGSAAGVQGQDSGGPIPLTDSADTDRIDLKADSTAPPRKEDPRQATGISVFDADEIEPADPMAQTQVTAPVSDQEDLALESVGSGSGLLDLTRESDDTSLGAELLDEIYPGEGSDAKVQQGAPAAFASEIAAEASGASGLESLQPTGMGAPQIIEVEVTEASDPAGSGLGVGFLVGATAALVIGLIVVWAGALGSPSSLTKMIASSEANLWMWCGGILVASIVFGVIGLVVGMARAKSAAAQ